MKKIFYVLFIITLFPAIVLAENIEVSTYEELKNAIENGNTDIILKNDIIFDSKITISSNVKITGSKKINRAEGYTGSLFGISSGAILEINDVIIDGGAPGWSMDYENRYYTSPENKGYVRVPTTKNTDDIEATASLITNAGNLTINNTEIKNIACTVVGCAISGTGNNTINNSTFNHIGSSKNGGAINVTTGTTIITNSTFKDNVAGYGVVSSTNGGAIYISGATLIDITNSKFEDNYAQNNGAALFLGKANISIKGSNFKHNMVGNDGSALNLENNTTTNYSLLVEDSVFEKNHGFATTGQSMGTIWIGSKWNNTPDTPLVFRNLIFKQNIARTGGALADNASNTYAKFENIEVFENEIGSGGFVFTQSTQYIIDGINIHDNIGTNGSGIYVNGANVTVTNAEIHGNTTSGSGAGIYIVGGTLNISNSEITGNKTTEGRGGGIFVRGYYEGYDPVVVIENTLIKDNEATITGGGICISDNENIFSSVTIDDKSKIYDNKAGDSGDDFAYYRQNNSENNTNNTITLDNISIAGITGIDGWYHDNEGDRFLDTENPTVFADYTGYNGYGIYLKAAGISSMDYDLNGGSNNEILPIEIRYGQDYIVTDQEPVKDGYEFIGWNTKEDGTGISLTAGEHYDGREGYVLYAQYIIKNVNPPTGDKVLFFTSTLILSVLGLIGTFIITRKRTN